MFNKNGDFYKALVATFCLVSYADGQLHMAELSRFIRLQARDNPELGVDEETLTHDVVELGKSFTRDFPAARDKALKAIAKMKGDRALTDKIIRVARVTVVSDNKIAPSEETVVAAIADALGVKFSDNPV